MSGKPKKKLKKSQYHQLLKEQALQIPTVITKKSQLRVLLSSQDPNSNNNNNNTNFIQTTNNMPKAGAKTDILKRRHNPLEVSLKETEGKLRRQQNSAGAGGNDEDLDNLADQAQYVTDADTAKRVLQLKRQQDAEIEAEELAEMGIQKNNSNKKKQSSKVLSSKYEGDEDDVYEAALESDEEEEEEYDEEGEYEYETMEISPEDEALYNKFVGSFSAQEGENVTLADKIMARLEQSTQAEQINEEEDDDEDLSDEDDEENTGVKLPPKVIAVYSKVGQILSTWTSGKLPRAFKIIPTLKNWEDVLYVTEPEGWSPQAVYEATKVFISSLDSKQAQKFVFSVLLDRFRDELAPTTADGYTTKSAVASKKTLNYHTYRALKKSLYKPAAFFKGFLFPLAESGTCTVREATIAASILSRVSVPVLHSSAALMRLAEYEYYSAPTSLFLKVLLDKKYSLPYKAIDAVVFHFMRFKNSTPNTADKKLPILWHQSFLVFAQRYKNDITDDQRDFLLDVLKVHQHPQITPEIRRELVSGQPRGEEEGGEMDLDL